MTQHDKSLPLLESSVAPKVKPSSLPLEFLLARGARVQLGERVKLPGAFVQRVLARLVQLEAHEPNLHFKSDYRQASIVLILLSRGNTMPFVVSSYQMYGKHPDQIFPGIVAQRKADLGKEYSRWYDERDVLRPEFAAAPKKPNVSTTNEQEKAA